MIVDYKMVSSKHLDIKKSIFIQQMDMICYQLNFHFFFYDISNLLKNFSLNFFLLSKVEISLE